MGEHVFVELLIKKSSPILGFRGIPLKAVSGKRSMKARGRRSGSAAKAAGDARAKRHEQSGSPRASFTRVKTNSKSNSNNNNTHGSTSKHDNSRNI